MNPATAPTKKHTRRLHARHVFTPGFMLRELIAINDLKNIDIDAAFMKSISGANNPQGPTPCQLN